MPTIPHVLGETGDSFSYPLTRLNKRTKITLTFEVDLDMVPGWGRDPDDWVAYLERHAMLQKHYNPTFTVLSVE